MPDTVGAPMPLYLRNSDTPYWFEFLPADRDPAVEAILSCREHLPGW